MLLTYAIVDPGAVMVKDLNAVVANRAVAAPRRPIELAGDTPCCRDPLVTTVKRPGRRHTTSSAL